MTTTAHRLDRIFNARNVAIVGDSAKRNYMWTKSNLDVTGKLYEVHLDEKATKDLEAMGLPVYKSLLDIPDEIDYVIVSVPRIVAPQIVRDCVTKRVGGCVLFTAGFAETNEEEGIRLGAEITQIARDAGLPLVGPNCMGLYLPHTGVRHSQDQPIGPEYSGPLAVVSQSGTHATNLSQVANNSIPSLYMNLKAPIGSTADQGNTGPAGRCRKNDKECQSYNYGYNAAAHAHAYAQSQGATASMIWLDIETTNSWSRNTAHNARVIQGAADFFTGRGIDVGAYSTASQWRTIAGSYSPGFPNWVAGAPSEAAAPSYCSSAYAFGGGHVWLVQYISGGYDKNYSC